MSSLLDKFSEDLHLPQEIRDKINIPRNNNELKVFALTLPTLKYPDTYILAGRLFIYVNIQKCPRKTEEYIRILSPILRSEITSFLVKHSKEVDELLEETYYYNFKNYNILSASSCVNYLLRVDHEEGPAETPCQMALRQAIQFYHNDSWEDVKNCYYDIIYNKYIHASPTMFNAGTKKNQMSSCFLLTLGDNLESLLYTGAGDVGLISKLQGGIGMSLNAIRHSNISNTGKSSGVLPFAKIYDSTISCVDQGGKRNGAITMTLNDWHIDFLDFIQTRDNYTHNGIRFKQANICAYISRLFMERVKNKQDWTFFCPAKAKIGNEMLMSKFGEDFETFYVRLEKEAQERENNFKQINDRIISMETKINENKASREEVMIYHEMVRERIILRKDLIVYKTFPAHKVYEKICDMNVKSSMPYIVYRDTVNIKNNMSNIGVTEGLNLCLEITEPSTPDSIASCNLGHLNLKKFVKKDVLVEVKEDLKEAYDFIALGEATRALTKNINKVIDYNYYPLDERDEEGKVIKRGKISTPNFANRPIGIGVSGLAEVFALMDLYYDEDLAIQLNKMIFACIYYNSLYQSHLLALQDGAYDSFKTGECKIFHEGDWKTFQGSPLSNGFFQFDLWKAEADYLKANNRLNEKIYDPKDDEPIEPAEWGLEDIEHCWGVLREKIMKDGVRNSMLVAIMPTASSAQMLSNAETTEAHQTLVYSRKLAHGNYTAFSEPFVQDMIKYNLWNDKAIQYIMMCNGSIATLDKFILNFREYFPENIFEGDNFNPVFAKTMEHLKRKHRGMYEISQKTTMQMARQRGIYVCQSQSLNIYIPEPDVNKMKLVHSYSNSLGLKTGMYYLRSNPASQTGRFTVDIKIQQFYNELHNRDVEPVKKIMPKEKPKKNVVCTDEVCIMCQ
jgi:ribonucleotide reductase alpha subunit